MQICAVEYYSKIEMAWCIMKWFKTREAAERFLEKKDGRRFRVVYKPVSMIEEYKELFI